MENKEGWEEAFTEKGADLEHDRWTRWQKHMFSKGTVNEDGTLTIPVFFVERWFRQINTPYAELSESEKESDRKETRSYLPIIKSLLAAERARIAEQVTKELDFDYSDGDTPQTKLKNHKELGYKQGLRFVLSLLQTP